MSQEKTSDKILDGITDLKNTVDDGFVGLKKTVADGALKVSAPAAEKPERAIEHITGCSDCYAEVEEMMTPIILKNRLEEMKAMKHMCANCGFPVLPEYDNCPLCGSKDGKDRDWDFVVVEQEQ